MSQNTTPGAEARSPSGTKPAPACTLVIFGAGGDLTKRLVMPALYNLAGSKLLDPALKIIGVDHTGNDDDGWRKALTETMHGFTKDKTAEFHPDTIDDEAWGWITQRLHYVQGDFEKPETYSGIAGQVQGNAVFYLAVAARFFATVVEGLGNAKLLQQSDGAFRRVVIEKPFGSDLASAKALNARILKMGDESQFYRIDHFLGKEVVQNVMASRFANTLLEPVWRREYVDFVEITAAETVGVEERGGFYEPTGALRDMVPNHMFQLLSVVAMEPPNSFDAEAVRSEKAKVIEAVRPIQPSDAVRGQYAAGTEFGHDVAAYRAEPHVSPSSTTETYVALRLTIQNWRWADVPFYIRTGKRMEGRLTEIAVHFKAPPTQMFHGTAADTPDSKRVAVDDRPDPGVRHAFQRQGPWAGDEARERRDHVPLPGLLPGEAECRLRDLAVRLHDGRRHIVPARRQHRGRLGRRAAAAGRVGPRRRRPRDLRGRERRSGSGERAAGAVRPPLEPARREMSDGWPGAAIPGQPPRRPRAGFAPRRPPAPAAGSRAWRWSPPPRTRPTRGWIP